MGLTSDGGRRRFIAGAVALLATPLAAAAQPTAKIYRVGYLSVALGAKNRFIERLKELGYVEGRNLRMEYRQWGSRPDRIEDLAADLVKMEVDVIVAFGPDDIAAAIKATRTIPIVMVWPGDPVAMGFVRSLGHPGGNVTGMSWAPAVTLTEKAVQMLKEAVPSSRTIGVLWNENNRSHPGYLDATRRAIEQVGASYVSLGVRTVDDLDDRLRRAARERAAAVVIFPDPLTVPASQRITDLALKHRLPTMVTAKLRFDDALLVYGAKVSESPQRAADYVDRILKGSRPSTLPVEQPATIEFIVNLKTARALGLTIPPSVLLRATEVIE